MHTIYRGAECVSVWLGSLPDSDRGDFKWEDAVLDLANASYWSQRWIIQEFLLARDIEFYYGRNRISWDELMRILGVILPMQVLAGDERGGLLDSRGLNIIESITNMTPTLTVLWDIWGILRPRGIATKFAASTMRCPLSLYVTLKRLSGAYLRTGFLHDSAITSTNVPGTGCSPYWVFFRKERGTALPSISQIIHLAATKLPLLP
ncbi:hypothetical protein HD806DRAFT_359143 [Xylariaceae sp. AK1471]|nr:hypothetical protein HD806DRAFT_359143 [Xylariaceae sp. AK1471]